MKRFTLLVVMAITVISMGRVHGQDIVDLTPFNNPDILADTLPDLNSGAIVLLKPGMTYNTGEFAFDKSVTIQNFDPLNLNRPKINCRYNFNFGDQATVDSIIFRNLEFFGEYDARYVLNSTVAATIGKIMFDGCYIHDLRGVLRMKDAGPGSLDHLVINNSYLTRIRDYGVITVDIDTWICNNLTFTNSTFSKLAAFVTSRNYTTSFLIDGCNLVEATVAGKIMFRWRTTGQDNVTDGIMIKNTIFGPGWDEIGNGITAFDGYDGLGATTWTFENTYVTSDLDIADGKDSIEGFNFVYAGLSTDLWADLPEGNLHYADTDFAGIGNAGDQRWGMATADGGVDWNISHAVFNTLGTIDATKTVAGLKAVATSGATIVVDANNKTVGDMSFTNRLKFGGSGSFDADGIPESRVLTIDLDHSSKITVAAMSASGTADRTLNIAVGDKDNLLGEFPALGASLTMGEYDYYGAPTTLMLYSPSSGVNVYYIKIADINNVDADLYGLSLDVGELSPAFDPGVNAYSVELPAGTSAVTVTATPNDPNATVAGDGVVDVSGGSGTATVTVTAEDGTTTQDYVINFTVLASTDATLSALNVSEGTLDPVFDAGVFTYNVDLPSGTTTVNVTVTTTDPNATVTGDGDIDVSSGSGTATVVVTAEDGTTTLTYTVNFTVLVGIGETVTRGMDVYPTISNGTFHVEFAGNPGVIKVYDITGSMVLHRNAGSSIETINLNKAGIYMIRLESENQFHTVRVLSVN